MDYEFPAHVRASKECRDMLSRILVSEPKKRITIPEIQRHPWYVKDLPPGVVDMNDNLPPPSPNAQVTTCHMTCVRIYVSLNPWYMCWQNAT